MTRKSIAFLECFSRKNARHAAMYLPSMRTATSPWKLLPNVASISTEMWLRFTIVTRLCARSTGRSIIFRRHVVSL